MAIAYLAYDVNPDRDSGRMCPGVANAVILYPTMCTIIARFSAVFADYSRLPRESGAPTARHLGADRGLRDHPVVTGSERGLVPGPGATGER